MITKVNESKSLIKHVSCKCKSKFDSKKYNSNQKWNNDKFQCECKNPREGHAWQKSYTWVVATCTCENGKYLRGIIGDSVINCYEIIEVTKTV